MNRDDPANWERRERERQARVHRELSGGSRSSSERISYNERCRTVWREGIYRCSIIRENGVDKVVREIIESD